MLETAEEIPNLINSGLDGVFDSVIGRHDHLTDLVGLVNDPVDQDIHGLRESLDTTHDPGPGLLPRVGRFLPLLGWQLSDVVDGLLLGLVCHFGELVDSFLGTAVDLLLPCVRIFLQFVFQLLRLPLNRLRVVICKVLEILLRLVGNALSLVSPPAAIV